MRIGVNARFLTKPYTGIGQHTKYLFQALAQQHPEITFIMVTAEPVEASLPKSLPKNIEIHVLEENFPGTAGMKKTYWEQRRVPRFFAQKQVDLVHFPYPSNPWTGFSQAPVCVTVHDTIPWELPAYRRGITPRFYQDSCRFAVKKADHVFTVSNVSKEDILRVCRVPEAKISLSYNAPSPLFFPKFDAANRGAILQKYDVEPNRPYFFYVGGYDERKNVEELIKVFRHDIAPFYDIDLVLAGGKSVQSSLYSSFDLLTKEKSGGTLRSDRGKLVTTGFVAEEDLPALYQSSTAFVHLSKKEGCNLPLLEALVSGIPAIVSDIAVHHEMAGESALYVKPSDDHHIADTLKKFAGNTGFAAEQKQKISNYRCPFTWDKTAEEVYKVYKKLI